MRRIWLISAALFLGGCVTGPAVSPSDQILLRDSDQLHARLASAMIDPRAPRAQRYVEQLAARIAATARELDQSGTIKSPDGSGWVLAGPLDYHLVDHARTSSFAPGGRHVYLYEGLVEQCRGEDELASVMCHDFAHVYLRLSQHTIRKQPDETGDLAVLGPFALMRFSAASEASAAAIAFAIYTRAGWDPTRFAALEQRLAERSTDPSVDRGLMRQRAEEARKRVESLPDEARDWARPPIADDARFAQLQAEARAAAGSSAPARQAQLLLTAFPTCLNLADTPAQVAARSELFPPAIPAGGGNQWGKGLR